MGKGISLQQLKENLEGEAQTRCQAQEKTIKDLFEKIKEKNDIIRVLQNRCYVQTRGTWCTLCGMKSTCKRSITNAIDKELDPAWLFDNTSL